MSTRYTAVSLLAAAAVLSGCGGSSGSGDREVAQAPDLCEGFREQIERIEVGLGDIYVKKAGAPGQVAQAVTDLRAATAQQTAVPAPVIDGFLTTTQRYAAALAKDPNQGYLSPAATQYRTSAGRLVSACRPPATADPQG